MFQTLFTIEGAMSPLRVRIRNHTGAIVKEAEVATFAEIQPMAVLLLSEITPDQY